MAFEVILEYHGKFYLRDGPIIWDDRKPLPREGDIVERHATKYRVSRVHPIPNSSVGMNQVTINLVPTD
jgi:hypothetical protein